MASKRRASRVYLTGTLDAAVWGTELAGGDGPGRIYVVVPTPESLAAICGRPPQASAASRAAFTSISPSS